MNRYSRWLVGRALMVEGALIGVALIWAYWADISWRRALIPTFAQCAAGVGAGVLLLAANYGIIELGARYFAFFRRIKQMIEIEISPVFRNIGVEAMLIIALLSGVAEELFFRGLVQSYLGLFGASVVFGAAHVWRKSAVLYGVYAAMIGLYFGGLYLYSGSLWVPILGHIVNNFAALLYYRISSRHQQQELITSSDANQSLLS